MGSKEMSSQCIKVASGTSLTEPSVSSSLVADGLMDSVTAAAAAAGGIRPGDRAQTAPSLPPLMKGSRRSVLSALPARGMAPASGLGGELKVMGSGSGRTTRWQDKQQAWVEDEVEELPFLTKEEVLPDDRFEVGMSRVPRSLIRCALRSFWFGSCLLLLRFVENTAVNSWCLHESVAGYQVD